jgi:hypothetical protein
MKILTLLFVATSVIGCSSNADPGGAGNAGRGGGGATGVAGAAGTAGTTGTAGSTNAGGAGGGFAGAPVVGQASGTCTINYPQNGYNGSTRAITVAPGSSNGSAQLDDQTFPGTKTTITLREAGTGRTCTVTLFGPVMVGSYLPGAVQGYTSIAYSEPATPAAYNWGRATNSGGTVSVDSVDGKTFTFAIHNFLMGPGDSGPAAGTLSMAGSGVATLP